MLLFLRAKWNQNQIPCLCAHGKYRLGALYPSQTIPKQSIMVKREGKDKWFLNVILSKKKKREKVWKEPPFTIITSASLFGFVSTLFIYIRQVLHIHLRKNVQAQSVLVENICEHWASSPDPLLCFLTHKYAYTILFVIFRYIFRLESSTPPESHAKNNFCFCDLHRSSHQLQPFLLIAWCCRRHVSTWKCCFLGDVHLNVASYLTSCFFMKAKKFPYSLVWQLFLVQC